MVRVVYSGGGESRRRQDAGYVGAVDCEVGGWNDYGF